MKIDDIRQITAEDLRLIILALKVEEFNIDDENAKDDVYERIKRLPSAEKINTIASNSDSIKNLQHEIGYILELVDKYSTRDEDYKFRYKARTGLDPRYKVLEYKRIKAKKEIKMKKEAAGLVRELVSASSAADSKGLGRISGDLVKCAKNIKQENYKDASYEEIKRIASDLRDAGLNEEADSLEKEAGLFDNLKNMWSGVKEMGKDTGEWASQQGQKVRGSFQFGKLKNIFQRINKDVAEALQYAQTAQSQAVNPEKAQQIGNMVNMLGNMQTMGQDVYRIVEEEEASPEAPAAPEEEAVPAAAPEGATESLSGGVDMSKGMDLTDVAEEAVAETGAPAEAPAAPAATSETPVSGTTPPAETSSFSPGQEVTWQTTKGTVGQGTIVGPAKAPGNVIVQFPNGLKSAIPEAKLKTACERYRLSKQG